MTSHGFTLFDTPAGTCGLAWHDSGITGVQLPDTSAGALRVRMRSRFPAATERTPAVHVQPVVDAIVMLLQGEAVDLSFAPLDLSGVRPFDRRVYAEARRIPPGRVVTYGDLAAALGSVGLARAVGGALGRNPCPIVVPCHRVIAAGGRAGGFTAPGGLETKRRLLQIEGVWLQTHPSRWPGARPGEPSLWST